MKKNRELKVNEKTAVYRWKGSSWNGSFIGEMKFRYVEVEPGYFKWQWVDGNFTNDTHVNSILRKIEIEYLNR